MDRRRLEEMENEIRRMKEELSQREESKSKRKAYEEDEYSKDLRYEIEKRNFYEKYPVRRPTPPPRDFREEKRREIESIYRRGIRQEDMKLLYEGCRNLYATEVVYNEDKFIDNISQRPGKIVYYKDQIPPSLVSFSEPSFLMKTCFFSSFKYGYGSRRGVEPHIFLFNQKAFEKYCSISFNYIMYLFYKYEADNFAQLHLNGLKKGMGPLRLHTLNTRNYIFDNFDFTGQRRLISTLDTLDLIFYQYANLSENACRIYEDPNRNTLRYITNFENLQPVVVKKITEIFGEFPKDGKFMNYDARSIDTFEKINTERKEKRRFSYEKGELLEKKEDDISLEEIQKEIDTAKSETSQKDST